MPPKKAGGAFEACFATGLNLSEFGISSNEGQSASSRLLEIKAKESVDRDFQRHEEYRMQQVVQQRKKALAQKSPKETCESPFLHIPQPKHAKSTNGAVGTTETSDNRYLDAIVGNLHGQVEGLNLSRASRKLDAKGKREAKRAAKKQQPSLVSKGKLAATKKNTKFKF